MKISRPIITHISLSRWIRVLGNIATVGDGDNVRENVLALLPHFVDSQICTAICNWTIFLGEKLC